MKSGHCLSNGILTFDMVLYFQGQMVTLEPVDLLRVEIWKFRLRHLKEEKKCTGKEFEPMRPIFTELSGIITLCSKANKVLFLLELFLQLIIIIIP